MTASFNQKIIDIMKDILSDISIHLIRENTNIIVLDEYRWLPETLSLMAKQVNLCDSCMLLLENGMEHEAYILARSQFNNMLWIRYLISDTDGSRLKEFINQPYINQWSLDKKLLKMMESYPNEVDEKLNVENLREHLRNRINQYSQYLDNEGVNKQLKRISDLANQDSNTLSIYLTFYNKGSKIEHSDISSTREYRKGILDDYSIDEIFTIDMGKSNKDRWYEVFEFSMMSIFYSYEAIVNRLITKEQHLFEDTPVSKAAYNEEDLQAIMVKIAFLQEECK